MAHKFAVIGLGIFGSAIARTLAAKGAEVIAIDMDEEKVEDIKDQVTYAVTLDSTDLKALQSQNIQSMDAVVIAIGSSFQDLLLTAFTLQELGVPRILARATGVTQKSILKKMGIEEILSIEDEVSTNVSEQLLNPGVLMCMTLPDDYEIIEVQAPANLHNRTLGDIGFREKYNLNLVTLLREEEGDHHIIGVPGKETLVEKDDLVVVFGKRKDVDRFISINV